MTTCACCLDTPLGKALARADKNGLSGFWFVGQQYYPKTAAYWPENREHPVFASLKRWLERYFSGERPEMAIALAPQGTPFQRAVWDMLLAVPYGTVTTYGALARQLAAQQGRPSLSAQAVGGAVGHNPISLLIPCHRVVGSTGSLTGYAGGLDKKKALLHLEGADPNTVRGGTARYTPKV